MLDPELRADVKILDPACGSGGFLINTLLHWEAKFTDKDTLKLEWDGTPHDIFPNWPKSLAKNHNFGENLHGFDVEVEAMLRLGWGSGFADDRERVACLCCREIGTTFKAATCNDSNFELRDAR